MFCLDGIALMERESDYLDSIVAQREHRILVDALFVHPLKFVLLLISQVTTALLDVCIEFREISKVSLIPSLVRGFCCY